MLNFKVLAQRIGKADLWDKPLNAYTEEEVLQLASAISAALVNQEKTCGGCWYLGWKELKPWCRHPDHPGWVPRWGWGIACQDFSDEFDKELGPHKVIRKEALSHE